MVRSTLARRSVVSLALAGMVAVLSASSAPMASAQNASAAASDASSVVSSVIASSVPASSVASSIASSTASSVASSVASSSVASSVLSSSVASSVISSSAVASSAGSSVLSASSAASSVASVATSSAVSSVASSVTSGLTSSLSSSASSVSVQSSAASSALGCVIVTKQTQNVNGIPISPVAQFTFTMDGTRTATNDAAGFARFDNVAPGQHTVTENVPANWQQLSATPNNGTFVVTAGSLCASVIFVNRQTVSGNAVLQVQKTDGKTSAAAGETLDYSIIVSNLSAFQATNVTVVDVLPSNLSFLSASDNASVNGQTVTWTVPSIASATSRTLTLRARIASNVSNGTQIRNAVQANGQYTAEDLTTVSGGGDEDISISIKDTPDPVDAGDELDYEIEVCNEGDDDIENLTVLQILPDDVEVTDDDDGDEDDGTLLWEDIDIDEDDCVTFEVTVELDDSLDDGDELETVVLAGDQSEEETTDVGESDDDDDEDDDDDRNDGDLTVTKEASQNEVFPGGVVEYVITVENDTGEDLEDVVIEDRMTGNGFGIVDDGNADSRYGNTLRWKIDLDDGDSETIRYRVSVDAGAYVGQLIRNDVSVESDDGDLKDSASATVTVIGTLPQTGFGIDGKPLNKNLRPYKGGSSGIPAGVMLSLALTGIGAGVGIGRKVLLGA